MAKSLLANAGDTSSVPVGRSPRARQRLPILGAATLKPGHPGHRAPQGETPSQREVRTPPLKTQHSQKRINQFIFKKRATQGSQDTRSAGQPRARGPECVVTAQGMNRPGASLSGPHANANPNLPTLTTPHLLTKEQNASADSRVSPLEKRPSCSHGCLKMK